MVCLVREARASFAFAILSELYLFLLFGLSSLYLLNKLPRRIFSVTLFLSAPILLLFSVIQLGVLGEDCITDGISLLSDDIKHSIFAFHSGIRCILLSFFVLVLILVNKFAFGGTWLLGEQYSKGAGDESMAVPQGVAQGMTYAQPTTLPNVPQHATVPIVAQPAPVPAPTQPVHSVGYSTNASMGMPTQGAQMVHVQGAAGMAEQGQTVVVSVPQGMGQGTQRTA